MTHEGGNDRKIHAAIHQVRCEAVAQGTRSHAGAKPCTRGDIRDHGADIFVGDAPFQESSSKQRASLTSLQQVRQQLGEQRLRDRGGARFIAFALLNNELLPFSIDIRYVQRAQLAGAQSAAI